MANSNTNVACSVHGSTLAAKILLPELRDTESIQRLKDELLAAVSAAKPRNVILDLSHVRFIGSMGFLVFLRVRREPGVEQIVLCNLGEQVRGAFRICRLLPTDQQKSAPFEEARTEREAQEMCGES